MSELSLIEAQERRRDDLLNEELGLVLDRIFSEADTVGPDARHKLRGILRHYAKDPHPFRACVKDNMKRFGPGRTEAVCATLKDIIRGTTHWRGHPAADHGSPGAIAASDAEPITLSDAERREILVGLSDDDWNALEEAIRG